MQKFLTEIYSNAYKDMDKKVKEYFKKFAEQDKKKRADMLAGKMTPHEYFEWRRGKIMMGKHWKKMREQIAKDLHNVNKIATAYINGQLPGIYADVYNYTAQDLQKDMPANMSFELANARAIKILSTQVDDSFLPYKKLDPAKDIPWNMRKVNTEVLQGLIQGESIPQIAERIMKVATANKVSAVRAARTIVNTVENEARRNSGKHAQSMGCIVKKMWISAEDGLVRPWHEQADSDYGGEDRAIDLDDYFIVNGEKMLYAGDRTASANNLYNCRCITPNIITGFNRTVPKGTIKVKF